MPDRREVLRYGLLALAPALSACTPPRGPDEAGADRLWPQWLADWRWMEGIATRRGWETTPLAVAPPAAEAELRRIEAAHGLAFPPQLRAVLTRHSAHVAFGWHVPGHLQALEKRELPSMSANRSAIWDLAQIEDMAIPNFLGWKRHLAATDVSESPNDPAMWERQFPFYDLVNGDMLTIDMSKPDGPQPVRYFSHELEMLHGLALAPDFFTFVTEMSRLGFAGTEWASWMPFGVSAGDTYYLKADSAGGRAWRAWLERPPAEIEADEPPPAIVETTPADRALLNAARSGDATGVLGALAIGAKADAVWNDVWLLETGHWGEEFSTAVTYAVRRGDIPLLEALTQRGATLDTRRLPLGDAVETSPLETVRWLIAHGGRPNGWKDQRHWPLHLLVTRRGEAVADTKAEYERRLRRESGSVPIEGIDAEAARAIREVDEASFRKRLATYLDPASYRAMLEALLQAGAKPDAPWDNGITMLMWGDTETGRLLLRYGADIRARDRYGRMPLHWAKTPEKARLLVAAGAAIDARAEPRDPDDPAYTPLQSALLVPTGGKFDVARTLLELGANPKLRDGAGRNTLCYCTEIATFRLIAPYGIDPMERMPDGGTLLHNLLRVKSVVRAAFPGEVAMLDFLLGLGLDINAANAAGRTMLHAAAETYDNPADLEVLLARGADKTRVDKDGKRPRDGVPGSRGDIRALLT